MIFALSGCAATKKTSLDLQQCHAQLSFLESQIADKEKDVVYLEAELQRKQGQVFKKQSADPFKVNSEASSISRPSDIQIQQALQSAGYYSGSIDGKIGPMTQAAIMKFQKDNGLKADGKVGQKTWSALKDYLRE